MTETDKLLKQIVDELERIDVPTERIEVRATYNGEPDCTCGVCGEEFQFKETNIVDQEEFDYDHWDSEAVEEYHQPLDQQRLCRRCNNKFVQNGGEFPKKHYPGYEECPDCFGTGKVVEDNELKSTSKQRSNMVECELCEGEGAIEDK